MVRVITFFPTARACGDKRISRIAHSSCAEAAACNSMEKVFSVSAAKLPKESMPGNCQASDSCGRPTTTPLTSTFSSLVPAYVVFKATSASPAASVPVTSIRRFFTCTFSEATCNTGPAFAHKVAPAPSNTQGRSITNGPSYSPGAKTKSPDFVALNWS